MNAAVDPEEGEMMTKFTVQQGMLRNIPAFPTTFLTTLEEGLSGRKEALQSEDGTIARSSGTLETLPHLDRDTTRLQIKINRLLIEMNALRSPPSDSALAPVHRFPPEVLAQIFIFILPERVFPRRRSSPLGLSHVCSGWRNTALTCSRLWNVLSIDVFRHSRPHLLPLVITSWFGRANNPRPLSLSLANHISFGRVAEDITLSIIPFLPRLSELRFETVNLQSLAPILSLSGGRVPSLEMLILKVEETYPASLFPINLFRTTPNLRAVTLAIPSAIFTDGLSCLLPWKQLTCIDIQQGIPVDTFYTIIFSCTYLQTASFLICSDGNDWPGPDAPPQVVTFMALAILKIRLSDDFDQLSSFADILTMVDLPAIHTLSLESSSRGWAFPLDALILGRRNNLESIRTLEIFSFHDTEELFELIHACPLLETLSLQMPYGNTRTLFLWDLRMAVDDADHRLPLSHLTCFELRLIATDTIQSTIADLILLVLSLAKVCRLESVSLIITDSGDKEDVTWCLSVALYDLRRSLESLVHLRLGSKRTVGVELITKVLTGVKGA